MLTRRKVGFFQDQSSKHHFNDYTAKGSGLKMFYSQVNREGPAIETVRCGFSCLAILLHIPRRYFASLSNTPTHSTNCWKARIKGCLRYLWITRLSVQCNFIPCLIILAMFSLISLLAFVESQNGHYLYHRVTVPLLYPSPSSSSDSDLIQGPSLHELIHKLSSNYPNAHVIAGPPLSKEDLGHLSWLFLHTQSITYPEEPTVQRQQDMVQFWESFSRLYPCGECAKHMREYLKDHPPQTKNQIDYSLWLCRFHNAVTKRVNPEKKTLECDAQKLLERWKPTAFCGCDNEFIDGVDDPKENKDDIYVQLQSDK